MKYKNKDQAIKDLKKRIKNAKKQSTKQRLKNRILWYESL